MTNFEKKGYGDKENDTVYNSAYFLRELPIKDVKNYLRGEKL